MADDSLQRVIGLHIEILSVLFERGFSFQITFTYPFIIIIAVTLIVNDFKSTNTTEEFNCSVLDEILYFRLFNELIIHHPRYYDLVKDYKTIICSVISRKTRNIKTLSRVQSYE